MKLALAGPITVSAFAEDLHPVAADRAALIPALGGTPLVSLAKALLKRGHQLTIFTLAHGITEEIILDGPALKLCVGPLRARGRAGDFFKNERSYLERAITRERPDLVHAHWTYEFALAAMTSEAPTLVTAHDAPINVLRYFRDPYRMVRTLMAAQTLRRVRHLTAVSPHVAEHLHDMMGCRKTIHVVPNGFPEEFFKTAARPMDRRPLTFATALNGWVNLKNSRAAIRAFAQVRKSRADARMLMFGADHGMYQAAHTWSVAEGIADGIKFVGEVSHNQLRARLAEEVDVFLHPSLEESQGACLCEAMALGIPVIGGRYSGAVPWTLENGAAGELVDVHSPEELAAAMRSLADDPQRRADLGLAGQESVRRRFHIDLIASAYETEYQRALAA
jgi:glycosyltransferase involved in cell wall biosynthesis